jgi:tetratricopeptide (TPR) repeat protein
MLILGGYRDVELDRQHPLAAALADLRRETPYERLDLKGLDASDVGTLVDVIAEQDVPEALATAISAETDGNPLFVRLVLVNLVEEGKVRREDGRWTSDVSIADMAIPEGIREVIGRRLSRLSETANRLLTTASAMTSGFSWDVLRAISGESEPALVDAVDEVLSAHLVAERREGRTVTYDFTHALIRHTLYEELSTPRRIMLHRRIGEALEKLYARDTEPHLAELAYHFFEAAPGGDAERAIDYCLRAAHRALRSAAYEEAVTHVERAVEAREMQPSGGRERCELLLDLGRMQTAACYFATAAETYWRAADVARALPDAVELFGRAALGYAGPMYAEVGASDAALRLMREAAAALADSETSVAALILGRLSVSMPPRDPEREPLTSRAIAIARAVGDPTTLAQVLCFRLSFLRGIRAEPDVQVAAADEVIALGVAHGLDEQLTQAYAFRLYALLERGDIAAVDAQLQEVGDIAERVRRPSYYWYHAGWSAMRAMLAGRFDEGEALALKGFALAQQIQNINPFFGFATQVYTLRWDQGRLRELEAPLRSSVEQFPQNPLNATALAFVLAECGDDVGARAIFEGLAADNFAAVAQDGDSTNLVLLAGTCTRLRDALRAAVLHDLLRPFEGRASVTGNAFSCSGAVASYLAILCSTMQRWDEADALFTAGLAMNQRMGARPWIARTQYEYAAMLFDRARADDRQRAAELLDASIASAEELGMASVLERGLALRAGLDSAAS